MNKKIVYTLLIFVAIIIALITNLLLKPASIPLCPSIQSGSEYLEARYNPELGLLNEAPHVAPNKYWLTNDNALASFTLAQLGRPEMSDKLKASANQYGIGSNGLIEVIWGVPVTYPPYVARPELIAQKGGNEIWQEYHIDGEQFEDWAEYANLGFLGALNEFHRGNKSASIAIYNRTLAKFDGIGMRDKAFNDLYETYKLALGLYTGAVIDVSNPYGARMLTILQSMQGVEGGFYTHYRDLQTAEGDTNTETTSLAILAELKYGCSVP